MRQILLRFLNLFRGHVAERELSREIESHLALLQEDFERRGMSPEDARRAARREYGGVEQARELHREARSFPWIEQSIRDVKYGSRSLLRNPGFTLVAVLTLALGIGANTAIFSVVNAVLLRPLTYKDADRLVTILHDGTDPVAAANYIDWRDRSRASNQTSFETMGAADLWGANFTGGPTPERLTGLKVTQNLLPMLGVPPLLGRFFTPEEDQPGSERRIVLSYGLWQRLFAGDRGVLGKSMVLEGHDFTVIGVMPAEFRFAPFWATHTELWVPMAFGDRVHNRSGNSLRIFGRMKPGSTVTQAQAEITGITAQLEKQYPGTNRGVQVTPLKEKVVGNIEQPLLMLLAAGVFVLLIACANVANMLLARTSDRQKEIAVRSALGAGRRRVISQFLIENLLLAALGSLAGLSIAIGGTKALVVLSPAYIPRVDTVGIDARVVAFLLGLTLVTALVFGLAPAVRAAAANLSDALKDGGRGTSDGIRRNTLRGFLVASEFALAFVLLTGAGLMVRSFLVLGSLDAGFNPHNVLSMVVSVAGSKEAGRDRREAFYRQLLDRVRAMPGVQAAGGINHLPLAGDLWGWSFSIEGRPKPLPGDSPNAVYRIATPGYFEAMRLPLRRGRAMTPNDDVHAPGVVVINERAAAVYWPGEDPIGKRITFHDRDTPTWLTVIGIAANAKQDDWAAKPHPEVYLAALQNDDFLGSPGGHFAYLTLVVRTAGDPAGVANAVKQTVWSFDKNLPISKVLTMDGVVRDANAQPRFEMLMLVVFAVVALVLASVGIYGVMSFAVARRTREIGIRISLGATRHGVLGMLVRQGMVLAFMGGVCGVMGSFLLSTLVGKFLYGVRPTDPLTFAGVALTLGLAALLAAYVPARRATRIEPMTALRHE